MQEIRTRSHAKDRTFSIAVWQRGSPTPGTSSIVADTTGPGVDSAEPAASRILRVGARHGSVVVHGTAFIFTFVIGGTSVVYQPWVYDNTLAKWIKFGAQTTVTAVNTVGIQACRGMAGARFYIQIVTVNGAVTEFGYDY